MTDPNQSEGEAASKTLANARTAVRPQRALEKLGRARAPIKTMLKAASVVSELHPAAKVALECFNLAWEVGIECESRQATYHDFLAEHWQKLEEQEQCDENVEKLIDGFEAILGFVEVINQSAKPPYLRETVTRMFKLIEDASRFIVAYKMNATAVSWIKFKASSASEDVENLVNRFSELKSSFDRGVSVYTSETVDTTLRVAQTTDQRAISSELRELLKELQPVGNARYNSARSCLKGTRSKILGDILNWSQNSQDGEALLWVHGQTGIGKSAIATSVCQQLDDRKRLGASFFCKRDDPALQNPERVLRTLIYDLANHHSAYSKEVAATIKDDGTLCSASSSMQYEKLIRDPFRKQDLSQAATTLVLVVDALDECGPKELRQQLLEQLWKMSKLATWLKVIITSRPDPDIVQNLKQLSGNVELSAYNVHEYNASEDILVFVQSRLQSSDAAQELPEDAGPQLRAGAEGLFIWAKTACDLVLNSHNPSASMKVLLDKPGSVSMSALDRLYATSIEASFKEEAKTNEQDVRRCLGAIITCSTRTPLSADGLCFLLGDRIQGSVLRSVVSSLKSVLYVDDERDGAIRIYHPSFLDYITNSARSGEYYVDVKIWNAELAECCLQTMVRGLKFNICHLETSFRFNRDVENLHQKTASFIDDRLYYSVLHWISHLTSSGEHNPHSRSGRLLDQLFGGPKILFWIEALSLIGKIDLALPNIRDLRYWLTHQNLQHTEMIRDLERFIYIFYDAISESTPHLYLSGMAFAPTGSSIVQLFRQQFSNTIQIAKGEVSEWPTWLRSIAHECEIYAVSASRDGRRIACGSADSKIYVWNPDTGAPVCDPLSGHSHSVNAVAFSLNGRRLVSGSSDRTVRVWNSDIYAPIGKPLYGHIRRVTSVDFSPDGNQVVSGSSDHTVRVWDSSKCASIGEPLLGHDDAINSVKFSPNGHFIVSGSDDWTVRVWDLSGATSFSINTSTAPLSVTVSPDCHHNIVLGLEGGQVEMYDRTTGDMIANSPHYHSAAVKSIAISPEGGRVVSGSLDTTLHIWDTDKKALVGGPLVGHSGCINTVTFVLNGRRIVSGSADWTVRIWDADSIVSVVNSSLRELSPTTTASILPSASSKVPASTLPASQHSGPVMFTAFFPSGQRFMSGSSDKTVRFWDSATGAPVDQPLYLETAGSVSSISCSYDGQQVVCGSSNGEIVVYNVTTRATHSRRLNAHSGWVNSVVCSPNGRRIASGGEDMQVRIWDTDTCQLEKTLSGHYTEVKSIAFSPNGHRIASGSRDGELRVWITESGRNLCVLVAHLFGITALGFLRDGDIVSGSVDKTIRVWRTELTKDTYECRLEIQCRASVQSIATSPAGGSFASGLDNKTIQLWDDNTGVAINGPLVGPMDSRTIPLAYSPDCQSIVSGSHDGSIRVWKIDYTEKESEIPLASYTASIVGIVGQIDNAHLSKNLSGGWVTSQTGELYFWLPSYYQQDRDDSLFVITSRSLPSRVWVNASKFVRGTEWEKIWTTRINRHC
ncbi:hypothetical protein FRC09_010354 [Ceratobasidium sp. 395]|nr:hypothetical protein FRC09_010354 [Ceratobasidium sp. 395]